MSVPRRASARPPVETGAQPEPSTVAEPNATARGAAVGRQAHLPCATRASPPAFPRPASTEVRRGLRSSPGQGLPVRGRSPQSTRPLHDGSAAGRCRCATTRVASRALKDSIADL